jgi:hypothetical protein
VIPPFLSRLRFGAALHDASVAIVDLAELEELMRQAIDGVRLMRQIGRVDAAFVAECLQGVTLLAGLVECLRERCDLTEAALAAAVVEHQRALEMGAGRAR